MGSTPPKTLEEVEGQSAAGQGGTTPIVRQGGAGQGGEVGGESNRTGRVPNLFSCGAVDSLNAVIGPKHWH